MNEEVVAQHARLVPGTREAVDSLRARGLEIGSTTGCTRSIMARVVPGAAAKGHAPDSCLWAEDLPEGRPGPLQMYRCFNDPCAQPPGTAVKVDDTEPGILEGLAAECLTVGVALSGNHAGRTPVERAAMDPAEVARRRDAAAARLRAAGAPCLIDTVADLPRAAGASRCLRAATSCSSP